MSIYDNISSTPSNSAQMIQDLRSNPQVVLKRSGLTIPDGMNNPQQIIQHLIQSGQIPQSKYLQALRTIRHF